MQQLLHELGWNLAFPPLAVAIVGFMLWRGMLSRRALDHGPTRDLDLTLPEAVLGAVLGPVALLLLTVSEQTLVQIGLQHVLSADAIAVLLNVLQTLAPLGLIMVFLAISIRPALVQGGYRKIGLIPRWPWRDLRWALVAVPIAVVLSSGTSVFMILLGEAIGMPMPSDAQTGHQTLETLQQTSDLGKIIGIVLIAAILAPLIEEICFRGVMQTALLRLSGTDFRWHALLITAVVFGLIHYSAVTSWHMLPALIVLGLVFGYVYERTGSLLCAILVHAGFNAVNLGLVLLERVW